MELAVEEEDLEASRNQNLFMHSKCFTVLQWIPSISQTSLLIHNCHRHGKIPTMPVDHFVVTCRSRGAKHSPMVNIEAAKISFEVVIGAA